MEKPTIGKSIWNDDIISHHHMNPEIWLMMSLKKCLHACLASYDEDDSSGDEAKEKAARAKDKHENIGTVELRAILKSIERKRTMDARTLEHARAAYAKFSVIRFHSEGKVTNGSEKNTVALGELLSLYAPDGTPIQPATSILQIGFFAKLLMAETESEFLKIDRYDPLKGARAAQLTETLKSFSSKAVDLHRNAELVDPCDRDKCEKSLQLLCNELTELQRLYQVILCKTDELIRGAEFQAIMEEPLRAAVGKLGYALTCAWIIFREVDCPCTCDRDHLLSAWSIINIQALALRSEITSRVMQQLCPPSEFCNQATQELIATSEQGLATAKSLGDGCLSLADQETQVKLVINAQHQAAELFDKLRLISDEFKTREMDQIWSAIATILFCVDECKQPEDECEAMRQQLDCLFDVWGKLSTKAKPIPADLTPQSRWTKPKVRPMNAVNSPASSAEINQLMSALKASLATASPNAAVEMSLALRDLEAASLNIMGSGAQLYSRGKARIQSLNITPQTNTKAMMVAIPSKSKNCGCTA